MASSKGSRSMSWLNISSRQQKLHRENHLHTIVDYEKFVCQDSRVMMRMLCQMGFSGEIDTDNSNEEYSFDGCMSLTHTQSSHGSCYSVYALLPGFKAMNMFTMISYNDSNKKLLGSEGTVEFRGAFFAFREIMKEQAPEIVHFYDRVRRLCITSPLDSCPDHIFRRNRIDIAIDVRFPIDQKWEYKFIKPSKNSKRIVHHYNYKEELGGWQSFSYLPPNSKGIGIRVYNKILDIVAKSKESWYPDIDVSKDVVTRIELVYYSPYAENSDEDIISSATSQILGAGQHKLTYVNPLSVYNPNTAHTYFTRYSKNHGKKLLEVLDDVMSIEIRKTIEYQNT